MTSRRSIVLRAAVCTLLALGACSGGADEAAPREPAAWFTDVTDAVGLDFVHESGASGDRHMPEIMGPGCALLDADGDGDLDIYLVNGNHRRRGPADAPLVRNRLYLQESGGIFVDATDASGLGDDGYGMGVAVADYDNDGDPDVYVTNDGPDRLYRNEGHGRFTDVTTGAGVLVDGWSSSAAFVDYDLDGHLDLYVARYVVYDPRRRCVEDAGRPDYCGPREFPPAGDVLLHNDGDGTFTDVSAPAGIRSVAAAGLGVVCEDFDRDGWPDLYVANDAYANQLWMNRGDGTFRDEAIVQGCAYNLHGHAEAGMGVVAADFDGDLDPDLFLSHLAGEHNTYYRNLGPGRGFMDATGESGLGTSSMPFTGFGTAAFDADLDGDLDLVVVNGRVKQDAPRRDADVAVPWDRYAEPNLFYVNDGRGSMTLAPDAAGTLASRVEVTRGLAVGDVDGDGDLDVLVSTTQGPARLYRNDAPRRGSWLAVRALDPGLGRDALGAAVTLLARGRPASTTVSGSYSYLSSSPPLAHFGVAAGTAVEGIEVLWPDGRREEFEVEGLDRSVTLVRGMGEAAP